MNTKDHVVSGNVSTERALDLALEALEIVVVDVKTTPTAYEAHRQAITAIKQARSAPEEPIYHLRQFGDVTKEQLDRYMETGDINPQPAPVPDALTDQDPETPEYKEGWNDCRAFMLNWRNNQ
jgi:hypothetical protein